MNKTTKPKMIPLSLLLIPLLLLLPAAHASTISTGGGTFQPTGPPTIVSSHQFNGFLILRETFGLQFTGTLTGTTTGTVIIIINLATGQGAFFGQNDFTGTVTTSAGPASGTILSPFSATFAANHFQGQFTLYGGTGDLTNLHGHGTIQGDLTTFIGTYTSVLITGN